ncbi:MAG: STN domain-containing protein, partial [Odoribacter sp.]|nr:STN domain-containing protein [Odoribacter sp.]
MNKNHYTFRECYWRMAFLFLFVLPVCTVSAAQVQVVVKGTALSIQNAIRQIEQNSEYTFFYKAADLAGIHPKDFDCEGEIEEVLREMFMNSEISYQIRGKEIILKSVKDAEKEVPRQEK